MQLSTSLIAIAIGVQSAAAFTTVPTCQQRTITATSTTARSMGLFDFFNDDAKKEREEKREREIEEQMKYQREIIARRSNPEKMEEYEAKVQVRRQLRMNGDDEGADKIEMYSEDDNKIVGIN